ncbi:MAG: hydrogenase maturation protease [Acidimicrobiales bacterium]
MSRVVVAGIGNAYRGDDGVGPAVAAVVEQQSCAIDIGPISEPLDLIGRFDDAALAVLIDATRSGSAPGTIRAVEWHEVDQSSAISTHALGLRRVCELASALGEAPRRTVIVGIEGEDFTDGNRLSGAVANAVPRAARQIVGLISEWMTGV